MPLPGALNEKYLTRLQELIDEGEALKNDIRQERGEARVDGWGKEIITGPVRKRVDGERFREWQTKCGSVLGQIIPRSSVHWEFAEKWAKCEPSANMLKGMLARLRGIKDNYENGFYDDLPSLIRAEMAADYLEQAMLLFGAGYHVPAAVLAGAVLEDALRKLCVERSIPTKNDNGTRKTIDPMNTDLAKIGVYNAAKAAEIRGWAALRNAAAHGDGDKLEPDAVERMIDGVRSFVGDYLK